MILCWVSSSVKSKNAFRIKKKKISDFLSYLFVILFDVISLGVFFLAQHDHMLQEYEIDKTLGITGPADVAKMGVDKYNAECRKIVMRYSSDWEVKQTKLFMVTIFAI